VRVGWEDGTVDDFSAFWLRDHCTDPASWDAFNQQKTVETKDIPKALMASSVTVREGGVGIEVGWNHEVQGVGSSVFDAAWLHANRHGSGSSLPLERGLPARSEEGHAFARIAKATRGTSAEGVRVVRVGWEDGTVDDFSAFWLRDHCTDPASWDAFNQQKTVETKDIPKALMASSVTVREGGVGIEVGWNHEVQGVGSSVFDAAWLHANRHGTVDPEYVAPVTWGAEMRDNFSSVTVPYQDVLASEAGVLKVLETTRRHGICFVSGTPPDKALSQQLVERIAPVQHTIYGGFWETVVKGESESDNIDSAYSSVALPAHTDGNYFLDTPGLQIFHCLQQDASGGDTLLVDGFRVAENVRRVHPAAFGVLSTVKVHYQHTDEEWVMRAGHATVGLDEWGRLENVHFNNLDRDTLRVPLGEVDAFYDAWRIFSEEVQKGENEVWFKLEPGGLIIIDNHRVMHGRSAFDGASGRRLVGCYVSRQDFHARHRVLSARERAGTLR